MDIDASRLLRDRATGIAFRMSVTLETDELADESVAEIVNWLNKCSEAIAMVPGGNWTLVD